MGEDAVYEGDDDEMYEVDSYDTVRRDAEESTTVRSDRLLLARLAHQEPSSAKDRTNAASASGISHRLRNQLL